MIKNILFALLLISTLNIKAQEETIEFNTTNAVMSYYQNDENKPNLTMSVQRVGQNYYVMFMGLFYEKYYGELSKKSAQIKLDNGMLISLPYYSIVYASDIKTSTAAAVFRINKEDITYLKKNSMKSISLYVNGLNLMYTSLIYPNYLIDYIK